MNAPRHRLQATGPRRPDRPGPLPPTPHRGAASRPIALRRRLDVTVHPQRFARRRYWVLRDPLTLQFVQLNEQEFFLWERLDGRISLEELRSQFERQFAPLQLDFLQLQGFLGDLHRQGLVLAQASGQGRELLSRGRRQRGRQWLQAAGSILALRFRGVNPDRFLEAAYPLVRPLCSRWAVGAAALLVIAALALVAVQFESLLARLPDHRAFFQATNLVWVAAALAGTKILHELGHAFACRRFGGNCHELGLMLLVFVPCLYCNVSDAWTLRSKWQRIAISAAGIGVELTLAAICTFLWWFSEPGLLHTLCFNTMLVCSLSTLLFNGNPLLRYDGYFVLSDLLEMPNLWQQSRAYCGALFRRWTLGVELPEDLGWQRERRAWLAVYGLASMAYRVVVLCAILVVVVKTMKDYRLEPLAHGIVAIALTGLLAVPAAQGWRLTRSPLVRRRIRWGRALAGLVLGIAAAAAVLATPWPTYVTAPLVLEPAAAQRVYVSAAGRLRARHVEPGQTVSAGQPLAELANEDLERDIARLEGDLELQQTILDNLEARRAIAPDAARQIPTAAKMLADIRQRLETTRQERDKLVLRAPQAGAIIPPPERPPDDAETGQLPTWSGTPLEAKNQGSTLDVGTLFCLVGEPHNLEAMLYLDQADVEQVRLGQRVRLRIDTLPGTVCDGEVIEVARRDAKVAPRELSGQQLPLRQDATGAWRPLEAAYQVRVRIDSSSPAVPIWSRGTAKIRVASQSPARRLYRYLSRTFRFEL